MSPPGLLQGGQKRVGPSQEQDPRAQRVAASQDAKVLLYDGLQERKHQLMGRNPLLLQAVHVRFREDAALPRHRVQDGVLVAELCQLQAGELQLVGDAVNDGARAAGALVVHGRKLAAAARAAVLQPDDDLRVLAAQLDDRTDVRVEGFRRQGDGVHLLDEAGADVRGDGASTAARREDVDAFGWQGKPLLYGGEQLQCLFRLAGLVELVVGPEGLGRPALQHYCLDRGGAHVKTNDEPPGERDVVPRQSHAGRIAQSLASLRALVKTNSTTPNGCPSIRHCCPSENAPRCPSRALVACATIRLRRFRCYGAHTGFHNGLSFASGSRLASTRLAGVVRMHPLSVTDALAESKE